MPAGSPAAGEHAAPTGHLSPTGHRPDSGPEHGGGAAHDDVGLHRLPRGEPELVPHLDVAELEHGVLPAARGVVRGDVRDGAVAAEEVAGLAVDVEGLAEGLAVLEDVQPPPAGDGKAPAVMRRPSAAPPLQSTAERSRRHAFRAPQPAAPGSPTSPTAPRLLVGFRASGGSEYTSTTPFFVLLSSASLPDRPKSGSTSTSGTGSGSSSGRPHCWPASFCGGGGGGVAEGLVRGSADGLVGVASGHGARRRRMVGLRARMADGRGVGGG